MYGREREQGEEAFRDRQRRDDNPYRYGDYSKEQDWDDGFRAAQRRDEDRREEERQQEEAEERRLRDKREYERQREEEEEYRYRQQQEYEQECQEREAQELPEEPLDTNPMIGGFNEEAET